MFYSRLCRRTFFDLARVIISTWWTVIALSLLSLVPEVVEARKTLTVFWNSTNPIFRIDNTDHVLSVNILDRINMICPHYDERLFESSQVDNPEISEIYRVPRWGYENCELTSDAQIAGVCVTPTRRAKISIVFREFTPLPGGLEFKPGHSYYFISTSNGSLSGLSSRAEGLCRTKNMKLKVEVLPTGKIAPDPNLRPVDRVIHSNPSDEARINSVKQSSHVHSLKDANILEKASPTPVMYIIHDRHPEDGPVDSNKDQNKVHQGYRIKDEKDSKEEDDDGGATSQTASALLICLLTAITLRYLM